MAKTVTVRIDDSTYRRIKSAAEAERRTISNFMEYATLSYVENSSFVDSCPRPRSSLRNGGELPNCCSWGFPEEGREIGHGVLCPGASHPTPTATQLYYSTVLRKTITPPKCGAGG